MMHYANKSWSLNLSSTDPEPIKVVVLGVTLQGEINKMTSLQMKVIDQRAVRDRFKTIKKKFQDKMKAEETGSGIAHPELTPVENAIEDIMERELEMEILHGEEDDEKNKKLEKRQENC